MENNRRTASHVVFDIKLHIVLVTKYRRKVLKPQVLDYARGCFEQVLKAWDCRLVEFGGEADHVHLLVNLHPSASISVLVNNLKTASSRRIRGEFGQWLDQHYSKPHLWHRAYFVASVGNTTLERVAQYVQNQGHDKPGRRPKSANQPR